MGSAKSKNQSRSNYQRIKENLTTKAMERRDPSKTIQEPINYNLSECLKCRRRVYGEEEVLWTYHICPTGDYKLCCYCYNTADIKLCPWCTQKLLRIPGAWKSVLSTQWNHRMVRKTGGQGYGQE